MSYINLDTNLCSKLRDKVNEYQHYSIKKTHSLKKDNAQRGWEKICAIMDRLDDTTLYLNSLKLQKTDSKLAVFDFYNFMNNAATLLDCIKYLGEIYDFDFLDEDRKSDVFNQTGNNGNGTDKGYFEYLRSLCSVHPIETSRHPEFLDEDTKIECSPFVLWNNSSLLDDNKSDLIAVVYTNNPERFSKYVGIKLFEIFAYVEKRFNLLKKLISHIDLYNKSIIDKYRQKPLKNETDFSYYCDYLEYLKQEYAERINEGCDEYFDYCKLVLTTTFSDEKNNLQLKKYQNAIKYGITFLHKYLQNLPDSDTFETSGLKTQPPNTKGDSLFLELQRCEAGNYKCNHMHEFGKLSLMNLQSCYYMNMADEMLKKIEDYWIPYLNFEKNMDANKITVFIHLASYFWRLKNDLWFSNNIPKDEKFR